jgi:U3 small nucleolar RNA-associated protein 10
VHLEKSVILVYVLLCLIKCVFFLFCLLNFTGLEVLVSADERFKNYKNDLFSHKSKELDRELMTGEENKHINSTISSYLRLLSGHLQLPASLRTLEYLIRRYK